MLAAVKYTNYPFFDVSELVSEPDPVFNRFQRIQPLKAGNKLPDYSLNKENSKWQQFFNGAEVHGPVLLRQLLNKPLVIGFYSNYWNGHGLDLLKQLNAIQHDIKANSGNLLVICSEKNSRLEKIVWDNNLSLSFYLDSEKEIAEKFGVYSDKDPIWNKFSGIDINIPLLATYVVSPSGYIEYDHIDNDFSKTFPSKDIVSAVQRAGSISRPGHEAGYRRLTNSDF